MALTNEQKALNKKATSLRNKAFNERHSAYRQAMEEAERTAKETDVYRALNETMRKMESTFEEKNTKVDEVRAQILALEKKVLEIEEIYSTRIDEIRTVRDQKSREYFNLKRSLENEVDDRFPDMQGFVSAAGWKPFEDFIEAARQECEENDSPAITRRPRP